ncbi:MAG TPA: hypothetical protein VN253_21890 [Kofleriaceae bacterium]|nr:hypothetical protein [Kofleriaceae bacterium]
MAIHAFNVSVGDQVFLDQNEEEVGAVRQVARDHLVIYIENAGDFTVTGPAVKSAHDGKVILEPAQLDERLLTAIRGAHDNETE